MMHDLCIFLWVFFVVDQKVFSFCWDKFDYPGSIVYLSCSNMLSIYPTFKICRMFTFIYQIHLFYPKSPLNFVFQDYEIISWVFIFLHNLELLHFAAKEVTYTLNILTSKCMDPFTPLILIYDSVTLPIMCKCMYWKSSRNIRCNTALNGQGNLLFKADYRQEISRKCNTALIDLQLSKLTR